MGGKPPGAILTDQDKAMKSTIAEVFPNSRHRFCLWHILMKLPQKLGQVIKENEDFMEIFDKCIYNSWTCEEFEKRWWDMIERFELQDNEWLASLFEDHAYWIPTYMRDTFFAGMSTTQRSKSINSFFDKYVNKKTTLKEFVRQYCVALQDRQEQEAHADFRTWYTLPPFKSPSPFERKIHALAVFHSLGIFDIPSHYILERWTKHVKTIYDSTTKQTRKEVQYRKQRFDELFQEATKLSKEGSMSSESFEIAYLGLKETLKKCAVVNQSLKSSKEPQCRHDGDGNVNCNTHQITVLDPQVSKTKKSS
ncbi:hypothetical protein M0R45_013107 [Rubus argutus]|uniref:Protein FAR1-RELATED SEQUENCE n=1 Tax=Rubus argutus TaxID=59490 RepID=A0AAW1XKQ5_RUBAR